MILDGGMGRQLERSGAPFGQPEWSALALIEAPDTVLAAHRAFIAAGTDLITTNSYALVPFHIGERRFAEDGARLAALAGTLARDAADEANADISPLRADVTPDRYAEWARDWRHRGATLIGGGCGIGPEHIRGLRCIDA